MLMKEVIVGLVILKRSFEIKCFDIDPKMNKHSWLELTNDLSTSVNASFESVNITKGGVVFQ